MMRAHRLLATGLATLGVLAGGLMFAGAPALAAAPEVKGESVPSVTPFEARLEGVVNAGEEPTGKTTECHFQYGETSVTEHESECEQGNALEGGEQIVGVTVTGLEPKTPYHYRVVVKNTTGEAKGIEEGFMTLAKPIVTAEQAQSTTRVTATVSAQLHPEGSVTTYHVLYGVTGSYGQHTAEVPSIAVDFGEEEAISVGLVGLTPGTTYHYAFVATNSAGSVTGPDQTFTTAPPTPPTAATGGASNITLTTATVSGTINPEGLETSYEVDLGVDTTYGTSIYGEAGSGTENIGISVSLQDLAPGATYHYRIVAINSDGRAYGADQTFTTPAYSNPIVLPNALPLLQTPPIAFPTGSQANTGKIETKKLTNAQKLSAALKACAKKPKSKRAACRKQAHKKYPPAKKKKK